MQRSSRKSLEGKVTRAFAPEVNRKTITVTVDTYKKHPLYSKRFKSSKKFQVHDELNIAREGDFVQIMETRPLSATKRYRLVKILDSAKVGE
ncbi:30S ribosomal protein S17 [Mycoplasmopsis agassizii]|uniref:Small ribosomal subunit protein uS17 n=1 Tax=Mycoplasmopsis agassizii TaxID=33922 RepID=A0A1W1X396_9BACT|nr:30S ribosomal protein S17 [Mycoplasmopsis agassizii]PAF55398.1 30S ribosomal protein S17 [Mycoplasmopsis agassizii]PAK21665.1 30S ribosomal protein S17 [Mycoplasmopsis agassizii]SMC18270.1 small subunit ribosomal protein S17 [Mycoplasmopsis agassizii]